MVDIRNNDREKYVSIIHKDSNDTNLHPIKLEYNEVTPKRIWRSSLQNRTPLYIEAGITEDQSKQIKDSVSKYNEASKKNLGFLERNLQNIL